MDQEEIIITLGSKNYSLLVTPFLTSVDVDDLVKIDYSNILGEVLTFSVLLNKIGLMKADCDNLVLEKEFEFKIFEARKWEESKKSLTSLGVKTTEKIVENHVLLDPEYKLRKYEVFRAQKQAGHLNSLYWSCKDKSGKLDKLTDKLRPEEFMKELLEDTINGVIIKKSKLAPSQERRYDEPY